MEQLENIIREYLLNKQVTDIEFYNINSYYYSPDPDHSWIINGGIQLGVGEEKFSFGWNIEKQFFDAFPGPIGELTKDLEVEALEAKNAENLASLIGKSISDVDIKWNFYQEYDENFELKDEKKYMPSELLIHFDDQSALQIAGIQYHIENNQLKEVVYDSQGDLLISVNKIMEIEMPVYEDPSE